MLIHRGSRARGGEGQWQREREEPRKRGRKQLTDTRERNEGVKERRVSVLSAELSWAEKESQEECEQKRERESNTGQVFEVDHCRPNTRGGQDCKHVTLQPACVQQQMFDLSISPNSFLFRLVWPNEEIKYNFCFFPFQSPLHKADVYWLVFSPEYLQPPVFYCLLSPSRGLVPCLRT